MLYIYREKRYAYKRLSYIFLLSQTKHDCIMMLRKGCVETSILINVLHFRCPTSFNNNKMILLNGNKSIWQGIPIKFTERNSVGNIEGGRLIKRKCI